MSDDRKGVWVNIDGMPVDLSADNLTLNVVGKYQVALRIGRQKK